MNKRWNAGRRYGTVPAIMISAKRNGSRTRAFFAEHRVAYTEFDITKDRQALERYTKFNVRGASLIFVGDIRVPGFNKHLLRRPPGIKWTASRMMVLSPS